MFGKQIKTGFVVNYKTYSKEISDKNRTFVSSKKKEYA